MQRVVGQLGVQLAQVLQQIRGTFRPVAPPPAAQRAGGDAGLSAGGVGVTVMLGQDAQGGLTFVWAVLAGCAHGASVA